MTPSRVSSVAPSSEAFTPLSIAWARPLESRARRPVSMPPGSRDSRASRAVDDVETLLGGVLELLGGRHSRGVRGFERVMVAEDSARRLTVTITYSGLSGLHLAGELRGRDRRPQSHIQVKPVTLISDSGNAELTFEFPLRPKPRRSNPHTCG